MNIKNHLGVTITAATSSNGLQKELTNQLALLDLEKLSNKGINVVNTHVDYDYADLDDDGGTTVTEFILGVVSGILSTYTADGLLYLVKMLVRKLINKVPRAKKTKFLIKINDRKYNILVTDERLEFKALISKTLNKEDLDKIDREFELIRELLSQRFDNIE
tara:strand:+ start:708 stop:1193 length:486 start_codon:yes stop_codon:yes gene_type:complete